MPAGIPVATMALDGAKNASILASRIIGSFDSSVARKLGDFQQNLKGKVLRDAEELK
jgi:5-(carboxyamino)imidazole ribonucleotide mutase